jgi:hypothetical protein
MLREEDRGRLIREYQRQGWTMPGKRSLGPEPENEELRSLWLKKRERLEREGNEVVTKLEKLFTAPLSELGSLGLNLVEREPLGEFAECDNNTPTVLVSTFYKRKGFQPQRSKGAEACARITVTSEDKTSF